MYTYIDTCIHIHIHIYSSKHMDTHTHKYINICIHKQTHIYVCSPKMALERQGQIITTYPKIFLSGVRVSPVALFT